MILLLLSAFAAEPAPPVVCCDSAELTSQVKLYLRVQRALNENADMGELSGPMYGWAPRVKKLAASSPAEQAAIDRLAGLTERLKNSGKSTFAKSFPELSQLMTFLVLRHPGGSLTLREAACGDRVWLQRDGALASPYADGEDCGFRAAPAP